jgi:hypothetical protein
LPHRDKEQHVSADSTSQTESVRDEDYSKLARLLAYRALTFARVVRPIGKGQRDVDDERLDLMIGELIRGARDNLAALQEAREYADARTRQAASAPLRRDSEWDGAVKLLGRTRSELARELRAHQQAETWPWGVARADREAAWREDLEELDES